MLVEAAVYLKAAEAGIGESLLTGSLRVS